MQRKLFLALLISTIGAHTSYAMELEVDGDGEKTAEIVSWLEDFKYDNPLAAAVAARDHHKVLLLLTKAQADVNAMTPHGSALHVAAATSNPYIAEMLIEYNANKELHDSQGKTPLEIAKEQNRLICEWIPNTPDIKKTDLLRAFRLKNILPTIEAIKYAKAIKEEKGEEVSESKQ